MELRILRYESLPSTNTEALSQARKGAPEGLCVVADEQTEGRGRHGRTWVSAPGAGLYFSAVLRPKLEPRDLPLLTLASAVAVNDVLKELYDISTDIKWPNDLLVEGRKIAGILAETTETEDGTAVVVGIGINLRSSHLPEELASASASVESETGAQGDRDELLERLVRYFFFHCERTATASGRDRVLKEWSARSSYGRGKHVRVDAAGKRIEGITDGIDGHGALIIRTADGTETVQAGDVTALR
ncbi:MAG: biotin--[acetyl-CoA-carboxylase] ligase [Acidobacteriota bacterium]|nr:MAG: biotin--[acetyl-CoA-carboxylase] ligase [Acidobacteriota bacterium]